MTPNPWNLNPNECKTLAAMIEHGCDKGAARALHIEASTVKSRNHAAREKMAAVLGQPVSRLQAAVLFDRFVRGSK